MSKIVYPKLPTGLPTPLQEKFFEISLMSIEVQARDDERRKCVWYGICVGICLTLFAIIIVYQISHIA